MPGGCPVCSEEGAPANTAPVYARQARLRDDRLSGRTLARYAAQLPVPKARLVSLGEGGTPLVAAGALGGDIGLRRLLVKDERRNPTGSWRDRFAAAAVSQVEDGDATVAAAGEEALCVALAAYAARAGLRSVSVLDPDADGRALAAIEATGGRAVGVRGHAERWHVLAAAERQLGWKVFSNRTAPPIGGDPLAIEAYKTIAYEIIEDLRMAVPDLVLVPAALGDGLAGIWRGFRDLAVWNLVERTPRMVAVEVAGSVASALASGKDWVAPSEPSRSAARTLAGITGTVQSLEAVIDSEGLVVRVTDAELEEARVELGEREGIWADLSAAAGIAAAAKLAERGSVPAGSQAVAVITQHGALDASSAAPAPLDVVEPRVDDLLRVLAVRGE